MTMSKALIFIAIGTILLAIAMGFVLVIVRASGTAFALVLVLSLSLGGLANFFATVRYGSPRHRPHH
jgi:hypothetical protein